MKRTDYQTLVQKANRIVVKVGTSTLTHATGKLNLERIEHLVRQLTDLRYQGKEVVLVSSGAIGAGMGKMNLDKRPKTIPEKQAVAAIGQGILMQLYEKLFSEKDRNEIKKMRLPFKDLMIVIQTAMELIQGEEDQGEQ